MISGLDGPSKQTKHNKESCDGWVASRDSIWSGTVLKSARFVWACGWVCHLQIRRQEGRKEDSNAGQNGRQEGKRRVGRKEGSKEGLGYSTVWLQLFWLNVSTELTSSSFLVHGFEPSLGVVEAVS